MIEAKNNSPKGAVREIMDYLKKGDLDAACELGESYQQRFPDNEYILTALAKSYLEKSRQNPDFAPFAIRNAKVLLGKVCTLSPGNNVAPTLLSTIALREQNYQHAKELIEPVYLREKPPNARVMGIYCTALAALQKPEDVISVADEMIRIEPTNHNGFRFKAEALLVMEKIDDAMKCAKVALLLSPGDRRMQAIMKALQAHLAHNNAIKASLPAKQKSQSKQRETLSR